VSWPNILIFNQLRPLSEAALGTTRAPVNSDSSMAEVQLRSIVSPIALRGRANLASASRLEIESGALPFLGQPALPSDYRYYGH
jgi:hypothetical protein